MRNTCLDILADPSVMLAQLSPPGSAPCMTDRLSALSCLLSSSAEESVKQAQVQAFYDLADGDALVLNKWFAIQVTQLPANGIVRLCSAYAYDCESVFVSVHLYTLVRC